MSKRYPGGIIRKTPQTPSQTSAQGIWDMASVTQAVKENTWPIAGVPDPISKSLRFRSSASAYLNRTGSTVTNAKLATYSFWMKRGILTTGQWLFTGGTTTTLIGFNGSSDSLSVLGSDSSGEGNITTAVFRDPSAWYHVVIAIDTSQATTADRAKIYVNGVQQAVSVSNGGITLNSNWGFNTAGSLAIGRYSPVPGSYFDGYLAEVYFIGGQALTPSSFGNTNDQTGVWQPIAYTGTYGTNGFYLPFSNTASTTTLGYDFSGNSNNWTTNNISLTSGTTYDSMVDVPTQWIPYNTAGDTGALFRGNYCVLNPISRVPTVAAVPTITNGNLDLSTTTSDTRTYATFGFPTSGKYYYELTNNNSGSKGQGIASYDAGGDTYQVLYFGDGNKRVDGTTTSYGASYTTNDVIGVAVDIDNNQVTFYKNGTSQGAISYTFSSKPTMFPYVRREASTDASYSFNFGQRPFSYTPPSGFKTLNTTNLPTPTIGATSTTQAADYFNAITYTGNGSTQTVTGLDFTPGMLWIKDRSAVTNHQVNDQVRGVGRELQPDATTAETNNNIVTAFNSNGFSLSSNGNVNANGDAYVAWIWKAAGSGVTNTAGTITSTVSADTTAGFSIVTYTGTGVAATVGHGLGVTPNMVIVKARTAGAANSNWRTYHSSLSASNNVLLNTTNAQFDYVTVATGGGVGTPNSTTFSLIAGTSNVNFVNESGIAYVAYCFAQVAGYSAFGSYVGNDSADGTFIYTGFRPAFILYKKATGTDGWVIFDTKRNTYNVVDTALQPNTTGAEASSAAGSIDIVSNGFKQRNANNIANSSSFTYIYMAFAEAPFKYALAR